MSENSHTSVDLSDLDEQELASLMAEPPPYHTILEVWREVLKPTKAEALKKVAPQWAANMVARYNLTFKETGALHRRYYEKIWEFAAILDYEISTDPEALGRKEAALDAEENRNHYKSLLMLWQLLLLTWELEWDHASKTAGVEIAAISEIHKLFFGDVGVTSYLDSIGFQFDESDQNEITEALNELRAGQ